MHCIKWAFRNRVFINLLTKAVLLVMATVLNPNVPKERLIKKVR